MRVLIVDDEPAIRRTTRVAVEIAGHEAHEASGRIRAERALKEGAFDVVLLDLKLADGDGLAFLPEIRALQPGAAVVVFTAYARIADAVEAVRGGALDFVPKPFTPDQIRSVLARIAAGLASAPAPGSAPAAPVRGATCGTLPRTLDKIPATLEEIEAEHIRRILAASRSLKEAASLLGIDQATLYRKRLALGLTPARAPC